MDSGSLKKSPSGFQGAKWYFGCRTHKRPLLVNLEVTKHCNARCGFCACWQVGSPDEMKDYAPAIKKLRPLVTSISGGEPFIRKDLIDLIKKFRPYCHYLVMITNGALLTEDIADKLSDSGLNQLAISLDYLDEKHDEVRKIPGLFKKISKIVPKLTAKGYKIIFNTVIMEANLDYIIPLAHFAKSLGAGISYSSYCSLKRGHDELMISPEKLHLVKNVVEEIKGLKRSLGNIRNSDYYLNGIPGYFESGQKGGCMAGKKWVQLTPDGFIQPCSELPRMCRYDEYSQKNLPEITCTSCWYTCRGEAEAPHLAPDRLLELIRT